MYKPQHFAGHELFDQNYYHEILSDLGGRTFILYDDRVLITADRLRKRFGPIVVNDWKWGGGFNFRGFRPPGCTVGAAYSQHRFGRALDMDPQSITAEEIRADIIAKPNEATYEYITAIETDISWLHYDVRNHNKNELGLLVFKP
jgi:hypothetical protein